MTRISSLTTLAYTADIDARSLFMYVGGAKSTPTDLTTYASLLDPIGKIEGAMYIHATSMGGGGAAWTVVSMDTAQYDNTSWTNANSKGLFIVPSDEYRFVEVTYTLESYSNGISDYVAAIIDPSVSANPQSNSRYSPTAAYAALLFAGYYTAGSVRGVFPANSGDLYQPTVYEAGGGTAYFDAGSHHCFTIRGIR